MDKKLSFALLCLRNHIGKYIWFGLDYSNSWISTWFAQIKMLGFDQPLYFRVPIVNDQTSKFWTLSNGTRIELKRVHFFENRTRTELFSNKMVHFRSDRRLSTISREEIEAKIWVIFLKRQFLKQKTEQFGSFFDNFFWFAVY